MGRNRSHRTLERKFDNLSRTTTIPKEQKIDCPYYETCNVRYFGRINCLFFKDCQTYKFYEKHGERWENKLSI